MLKSRVFLLWIGYDLQIWKMLTSIVCFSQSGWDWVIDGISSTETSTTKKLYFCWSWSCCCCTGTADLDITMPLAEGVENSWEISQDMRQRKWIYVRSEVYFDRQVVINICRSVQREETLDSFRWMNELVYVMPSLLSKRQRVHLFIYVQLLMHLLFIGMNYYYLLYMVVDGLEKQ